MFCGGCIIHGGGGIAPNPGGGPWGIPLKPGWGIIHGGGGIPPNPGGNPGNPGGGAGNPGGGPEGIPLNPAGIALNLVAGPCEKSSLNAFFFFLASPLKTYVKKCQ